MHWFWLRFWFVGTDCQGFRATSAPWPPYIITLSGGVLNFQLGTCWVCGGRCRDHGDASHGFSVQGWFLSSQPGTWQCDGDSGQWRLMSDSYPRADGLGPTSGLSLNFFPVIVTWGVSQSPCCLRRLCWFSHQALYFLPPQVSRVVMSMASIFDRWAHVSFISLSTCHRDRIWQRMQSSVLYWVDWSRFLNKNSRPKDHFFFQKS